MPSSSVSQKAGNVPRPPVVAVLGHVDHGKTTLLDYIRKTTVAAKEAGGITQAVSAYEINHGGKRITFIDTPSHEAFMQMRSRGASIADLAILVVAAEDGVKPQTTESIRILKETQTPFVVAITKTDKPGANIEKVKADLAASEVLLEGYGGDVSWHAVSAKTGEGVSDLLDLLVLSAEVAGFSYDPAAHASGFVLEARITKQRGNEVVVILKNGTLRRGGSIATQSACGRIKILEDFQGKAVAELLPSAPALIGGFEELPQIGEAFSEDVSIMLPKQELPMVRPLEALQYAHVDSINLVIKSSDAGSLEAATAILGHTEFDLPVKIVAASIGEVQDGDVQHAVSTGSIIIGFKTKVQKSAKFLADTKLIPILTSDIIYRLIEAITEYRANQKTATLAELDVLAVFSQDRLHKQLVGGKVASGTLKVRQPIVILRGKEEAGRGRIESLRQGKNEVSSVPEGAECGVVLESGIAIAVGDRIVVHQE